MPRDLLIFQKNAKHVHIALASKTARCEERAFLLGRDTPQNVVTMRKTPETLNNIGVFLGPTGVLWVEFFMQFQRQALVIGVFGMLKRQVTKPAQGRFNLLIQLRLNHLPGVKPRQRVGGEHVRSATEAIARVLVQQQQQRQRAFWVCGPRLKLTPGGLKVRGVEGLTKALVEGLVLGKPMRGAGLLQNSTTACGVVSVVTLRPSIQVVEGA